MDLRPERLALVQNRYPGAQVSGDGGGNRVHRSRLFHDGPESD